MIFGWYKGKVEMRVLGKGWEAVRVRVWWEGRVRRIRNSDGGIYAD